MTRLLVGTDGVRTSERLAGYLARTTTDGDEIYLVNSLLGGAETTTDDLTDGEEALETLVDALGDQVVEQDQFVRGNHPVEDLLAAAETWGADELVIGIRKRSPVGKLMFGSTAQNVLLESDLPIRCVPLVSD